MRNERLAVCTSRQDGLIRQECELLSPERVGEALRGGGEGNSTATERRGRSGGPRPSVCQPRPVFADLNVQHSAAQRTVWVKYGPFVRMHSRHPEKHARAHALMRSPTLDKQHILWKPTYSSLVT